MPKYTVIVREIHQSSVEVKANTPQGALNEVESGDVTWHRHRLEHRALTVKNQKGDVVLTDLSDCEREKDPMRREQDRLDTIQWMIDESELAEAACERERQRIFDWLLRLAKIGEDNLNPLTIAERILNREHIKEKDE